MWQISLRFSYGNRLIMPCQQIATSPSAQFVIDLMKTWGTIFSNARACANACCEDFPGLCELSNGIFGEDLGL